MVTYGRSGSTLLQGILNSIPGYLVRGENGGVLYQLYRFHTTVTAKNEAMDKAGESSADPAHPWFGLHDYPVDVALAAQRRLAVETLLRPGPDTRVTGFKEVRWDQPDVVAYVAYLRTLFPDARFLVNTRNLADVARSKWWANRSDASEVLEQAEQKLLDLLERLGDAGFRVHYDDYVADPAALGPMFDWLGEPFDVAHVREVMAVRHSY